MTETIFYIFVSKQNENFYDFLKKINRKITYISYSPNHNLISEEDDMFVFDDTLYSEKYVTDFINDSEKVQDHRANSPILFPDEEERQMMLTKKFYYTIECILFKEIIPDKLFQRNLTFFNESRTWIYRNMLNLLIFDEIKNDGEFWMNCKNEWPKYVHRFVLPPIIL